MSRTQLLAALVALAFFPGCAVKQQEYEAGPAAMDVRVRQLFDMSEGTYFEGSYSYLRVERPDGDKLLEERLLGGAVRLGRKPRYFAFAPNAKSRRAPLAQHGQIMATLRGTHTDAR